MAVDREYRIRITTVADAAGANQAASGLDDVEKKTKKAGESAEHAGISHRALHVIFNQVGVASKELEFGLVALSGVMLGSVTFGAYALGEAIRLLTEHFKKQKEAALEAAKATVQFWTDSLQGNADARKAAADYAESMEKIFRRTDALKESETEEEAVLKRVGQERLKIMEAERQAEIAKAGGDKAEEARINARYGQKKSDIELDNELAEIDLKKVHLNDQLADAAAKERALRAAERAKEGGAEGRTEASLAEERLPALTTEIATLQAARLKPADMTALQAEVARRAGEASFATLPNGVMQLTAAGSARSQLEAANAAEEAYSAAQQEFEQAKADVERFKTGTEALAKAVEEATKEFNAAADAAKATGAEIGKAEAAYQAGAAGSAAISGVRADRIASLVGANPSGLTRTLVSDIDALGGLAEGRTMDAKQTANINALLGALHAARNSGEAINALLMELKDIHVDDQKKFNDLWVALRQVRAQANQELGPR